MVSVGGLAKKIFGSSNERRVKSLRPKVEAINAMENEMQALSDEELRARTDQFRKDLQNGASLDDILIPAFATAREASPLPTPVTSATRPISSCLFICPEPLLPDESRLAPSII